VARLPGIGPKVSEALVARGVSTVGDLVWSLPTGWDDFRAPSTIAAAVAAARVAAAAGVPAARACVRARVKSATVVPMRGRRGVRVTFVDDGATLVATWFFAAHGVLAAATEGKECLVLGRVALDAKGRAHVAHPDVLAADGDAPRVRARYPRMGAKEGVVRKAIASAMGGLTRVPDPVPAPIATREAMPEVRPLLLSLHGGPGGLAMPPDDAARKAAGERLAWGEAFVRVWERVRVDARRKGRVAPALPIDTAAHARLLAELGFALTVGQRRAMHAVAQDLASSTPARRLLLGDVGTGKTAVALAAATQCVSAGWQVAFLAPTTVLAEQTMDALAPLARATRTSVALHTGGRSPHRATVLDLAAKGGVSVLVGTHALLSEGVRFAKLGLVIVDEQQRLGVAQRLALVQKGVGGAGELWPHLLTLSATPIPRTLALALRGELATSLLNERPAGRPPVTTVLRPASAMEEVLADLQAALARRERAFWVCPRIDDVEDDDARGAPSRARELEARLAPSGVALIHGAMTPEAKRRAMRAFREGRASVLVGTTVVEVGVDVPEATRMVVEGAEHFGMSQLHQLRGRVGRGDRPGTCILLHGPLNPASDARLRAVSTTTSGIDIARADLALRGAGDLGGTRQSGEEDGFVYLDPAAPPAWLQRIEADARAIVATDPELALPAHADLAAFVRRFAASRRAQGVARGEAG
jgi:ATP-dependent DNA helicase RecG